MRAGEFIVVLGLIGNAACTSSTLRSAGPAEVDGARRCAGIAAQQIQGGKILASTLETAMTVEVAGQTTATVPHCRVQALLTPTSDSQIVVEVWLPASGWNGRFLGVGNGGYAGSLNLDEVARAVRRGYAAATTDTGHGAVGTDQWVTGHPEKVVDFAHRAIHLTAVTGKEITARFYGSAPRYAYFASCSNGGRQALMEASRYPEDYNGIVAGAPAADWIGLLVASFGWNAQVLRESPLPPFKTQAIAAAVLRQCDAIDGAADGIVQDPRTCHLDTSLLRCAHGDSADCLTDVEVRGLREIYAGPITTDGQRLYPGFSPGGEVGEPNRPGWESWILGTAQTPALQSRFFTSFMRDFVVSDPQWQPERFTLAADYAMAQRKLGALLNADEPDLSAFAKRGGKLILFHGWSDAAIPPLATVDLYERMRTTMGVAETRGFSRLYMVAGMQHCEFGPGAWWFNPISARPGADPRTDMAAALVRWTEEGIAPDSLIASRPSDPAAARADVPMASTDRTALLCPYPEQARYDRRGDPRDADSYQCASPAD